jgi:2-methylcitrate synthase/citrate synthase II
MSTATFKPGLEDVIAGQTSISRVEQTSLSYRGYMIADLAEHCQFEEVAFLLLHRELPRKPDLDAFSKRVRSAMDLPEPVKNLVAAISKNVPMMDVLRSAVSALGHFDPDAEDNSTPANVRKAERLIGQIAYTLGYREHKARGIPLMKVNPKDSHARNMLRLMLGKEPDDLSVEAINCTLILYAEHEFNASTFAARVITSTLSDMHSAVSGAIGALKGPLHGGANEEAMQMLLDIGGADKAEPWLRQAFAKKQKVMGFGHRVYKHGDHRAGICDGYARRLCERKGAKAMDYYKAAHIIQDIMLKEKNIYPNVDYPAGLLYWAMDIPIPLFTPIFVASRVTGWCAHVIEQFENNRIIRPRSEYLGPEVRKVPAIDKR